MINRKFFFDYARIHLFDGTLNSKRVQGVTAILDEWEKHHSKKDDRWLAYMLATVHHETNRTFRPLEEYKKGRGKDYGNKVKMAKDKNGNRIPYTTPDHIFYGRGFVQLTWYENYENAGIKLKHDFIKNPDLVMR